MKKIFGTCLLLTVLMSQLVGQDLDIVMPSKHKLQNKTLQDLHLNQPEIEILDLQVGTDPAKDKDLNYTVFVKLFYNSFK